MQSASPSNQTIHPADLQTLASVRNDAEPIFSLYLDLRAPDLISRFEALLAEAAQQKKLNQEPEPYRASWDQEAGRVRRWLETASSFPGQAQGLTIISSQSSGLWHAFLLPAPVMDRLVAKEQVHLRPLEILAAESGCTLVILAGPDTVGLVRIWLGSAEEVDRLEGEQTGADTALFTRDIMEHTSAAWQKHGCNRLVMIGSETLLEQLRDGLPESLRKRLVGEMILTPLTEGEAILARVLEFESEADRRLEAQRVTELMEAAKPSGAGVLGLEQVLLAVRSNTIRLLVVEEDFHQPGGECSNCGFLDDGEETVCLLCGMVLRPEPDIIEVALSRVLNAGGGIEVLRSPEMHDALADHGRIGALLRETETPAPDREAASHQPLIQDGEVRPEAVHDETVQESFPASDPPGGW